MEETKSNSNNLGILLMLAYAVMMVFSDSIAKELSATQNIITIVWYRYVFHTLGLVLVIGVSRSSASNQQEIIGSHYIQLTRGILLSLSSCAFFICIASLPLAMSLALLYIFPIISVILSSIFFNDKLTWYQWLLIALGFAGVVLVLQPSMEINFESALYGIGAGILVGIYMFLTKHQSNKSTPVISSIYSGAIGILVIPLFPGFELVLFQYPYMVLGAIMGVLAAIGHYCMFRALHYARASIVSPFAFSEVLFAGFIGVLWFNDQLNLVTMFGISLIVISGIVFAIFSED